MWSQSVALCGSNTLKIYGLFVGVVIFIIVSYADDYGYSRVRLRPRGDSAPLSPSSLTTVTNNEANGHFTFDNTTSSKFCGTEVNYDLPSNSRRLQALNVTLRRSGNSTPSSSPSLSPCSQSDYAKLGFTKEALLLRSGVTLRRHQRESLCSISSFVKLEGEEEEEEGGKGRKGRGGGSSGEEEKEETSLEPINK